jgi:hypothetical protein
MLCADVESLSIEHLSNRLDPEKRKELETHLASCSACSRSLARMRAAWDRLESLSVLEPSPALRARFQDALAAEKKKAAEKQTARLRNAKGWAVRLPGWMFGKPALGFAVPLALVVLGFGSGFLVRNALSDGNNVAVLRSEVSDMRRMLTLSLLNQHSASERLRGVQWSRELLPSNETVIEALLDATDSDPSTNIRLAALDALRRFGDRPSVRSALVRSLPRQRSPMVQVALIDLLVGFGEPKAVDALRELIQNKSTHAVVKQEAKRGIEQLTHREDV